MNIYYNRGVCGKCKDQLTPDHFNAHLQEKYQGRYIDPTSVFKEILIENNFERIDSIYIDLYNQIMNY